MTKKYIDLKEAYDAKTLQFWSNSAGDIFNPKTGDDCSVEEMPFKLKNLYLNYWGETYYVPVYVAEYNGEPSIVLNYLFDESYIEDVSEKLEECKSSADMNRAWCAVHDLANLLVDRLPGCTVFAGENTDPDGHEILILVPYRRRNMLDEINKDLEEFIYPTFEELF